METSYTVKRTIIFASLCVFTLFFQAKAQQATVDGILYGVVTVTGGDDYAETVSQDTKYTLESITIPAKVTISGKDYAVKKIGNNSMRENPNLKSLSLPEGLEVIGNSSFAQCTALPEVVVPSTVNAIEDWAFYGCSALSKINIPDGITSITQHTFQQAGLTSIVLPASVTKLDVCAFQTASKLSAINLDNITEIKDWALGETALTSVDAKKVKTLGNSAFYACPELVSVRFEKIFETKEWTFQGCKKLQEVTLPNTLESIDVGAFSGCSSLKTFTIPNSVMFLGSWAFEETGITKIYASWADPDDLIADASIFGEDEGKINFTWFVPQSLKDVYGDEFLGYPVESTGDVSNESIPLNRAKAYYADGNLTVSGLDGYNVWIYSTDGRLVARFIANGDEHNTLLPLNAGVYIFNAIKGNKKATAKFHVK